MYSVRIRSVILEGSKWICRQEQCFGGPSLEIFEGKTFFSKTINNKNVIFIEFRKAALQIFSNVFFGSAEREGPAKGRGKHKAFPWGNRGYQIWSHTPSHPEGLRIH